MSRLTPWIATLTVLATWPLAWSDLAMRALWPPVVALAVIVASRHALAGLLTGAFCGAVILAGGDPWQAWLALWAEHLAPSLGSSWKTGAIAFTLILGGFAAILDTGGGFRRLLGRFTGGGQDAGRRFQGAAAGLGLLCFFDGLANSMMVGRVARRLADRCGTSRVKLAYIVDSTSSAVACVAVVSTWIAFQLSMIQEAFALAGRDVNPYAVFLRSLPYNFHCWFTLVLLFVSIRFQYDPGPMEGFEERARTRDAAPVDETGGGSVASSLVPLAVLLAAFFGGFYVLGTDGPLSPITREKVVAAFGSDAGPLVMVLAGLVAALAAALLFPAPTARRAGEAGRAFLTGVGAMLGPVVILVAAWMLGSTIGALGTAELLARATAATDVAALVPLLVFLTGAVVSFATGTSWGTMGILFPLAVPAAAGAVAGADPGFQTTFLHVTVAAVFSGAVFGDHCSPFSDTTIVSSISCGVEPHDHVRTQIPYALIAAAVAAFVGFVPAGFGASAAVSLGVGTAVLLILPRLRRARP